MPFLALQKELDARNSQGLRRTRRVLQSPQGVHVTVDDEPFLSFCSNDYLGLAGDARLVTAMQRGAAAWGVGAGASHLVCGHTQAHHELESVLAGFVGKPAGLLFSTGYLANLGVVQALVGRDDAIFADRLNHASLNDAMQLSRAEIHRYRHNDVGQLAQLLEKATGRRKLVITDAVFSMDGDIALLPELLALCERYQAWLLVDDAHGLGVLGEEGAGSLSHFQLNSPRIIYMATLGKAAGVAGAFVAAEPVVIETLWNQARSYIYTTASPPALSATLLEAIPILRKEEWRRERLHTLTALLRRTMADLPWPWMPSVTPIQPLLVGSNQSAMAMSNGLRERGILVPAIRPPTVPQGTARLRISLSAAHDESDIHRLSEALHELAY